MFVSYVYYRGFYSGRCNTDTMEKLTGLTIWKLGDLKTKLMALAVAPVQASLAQVAWDRLRVGCGLYAQSLPGRLRE